MSYQSILTALKGSASSGNWGHAGRPGKHGGSAPGAGHGSLGIKPNASKSDRAIATMVRRHERKRSDSKPATKPAAEVSKPITFQKLSRESEKDLQAHYDLKNFAKSNKAEAKALTNYTSWTGSDNFYRVNSALRKGKEPSKVVEKAVKNLDSAFDKAPPMPFDAQTYRVTRFNTAKDKAMIEQFANLKPGQKFSDAAYVSTSLSPGITKNDFFRGNASETSVVFKVNVAKGKKAIYVKDLSHTKTERELLLPRGSEFTVKSNVVKRDGTIEIELDMN